jgi:predicted nucleic acid-binding protein
MRVPKIYLETTMFNYYFDTERDWHPYVAQLFKEIEQGKYEPFTSQYVIDELLNAPQEKRELMLGLIAQYRIEILPPSSEAQRLANLYAAEGVIPERYVDDRRHIAVATVNDLAMILSLNFRHIVREKTVREANYINEREGFRRIGIYAPMEVVENDD